MVPKLFRMKACGVSFSFLEYSKPTRASHNNQKRNAKPSWGRPGITWRCGRIRRNCRHDHLPMFSQSQASTCRWNSFGISAKASSVFLPRRIYHAEHHSTPSRSIKPEVRYNPTQSHWIKSQPNKRHPWGIHNLPLESMKPVWEST